MKVFELKVKRLAVATGLLAGLFSTSAFATMVSGTANIGGTVDVSGCILGGACTLAPGIYFFNTADTTAMAYDAGSANGSYAGLTNGNGTVSGGEITDLLGAPATGSVSVPNFATFVTTAGLIHFDLTTIFAGTGTNAACSSNAVGSVCTPTGSPFTLTQTNTGVAITLDLAGNAYLGTSGTGESPTGGLFTAQVQVPGTITAVLAQVASSGGLVDQTYSATFTSTATPEPATLLMALTGLVLVGVSRKSFRTGR